MPRREATSGAPFGRLSILSPQTQPIGLAVGGRYASSPDFGDGITYAPNRLGRADRRLRGQLGSREIDTSFSFYAVAGWDLPGLPSSFLPDHDFSFTAGWGNGLFKEGDGLDWYSSGDSGGWFAGVAWNLELAESRMLTFMSDYNGFDWNVGTQIESGWCQAWHPCTGRESFVEYHRVPEFQVRPHRLGGLLWGRALPGFTPRPACPRRGGVAGRPRRTRLW